MAKPRPFKTLWGIWDTIEGRWFGHQNSMILAFTDKSIAVPEAKAQSGKQERMFVVARLIIGRQKENRRG